MKKKTLVSLVLLASAASLPAADYKWNTGNGTWSDASTAPANWLVGTIPDVWGNGNTAIFEGSTGYQVTLNGSIAANGWQVSGNGSWGFHIPNGNSLTVSGGLALNPSLPTDTYAFIKSGTGTVTIDGNASINGRIAIVSGTLEISSLGSFGNFTGGDILLRDAVLRYLGSGETLDRKLIVDRQFTYPVLEVDSGKELRIAAIEGRANSPLRKTGGGTLHLIGGSTNTGAGLIVDDGFVFLDKTTGNFINAIGAGGLTINGGAVYLAGGGSATDTLFNNYYPGLPLQNQIQNSATVQINAGTLDLKGKLESIAALFGNAGTITNTVTGLSVLGIGENGRNGDFGGNIMDGSEDAKMGLLKRGQGTLILTGSNTYTGKTIISRGETPTETVYGKGGVLQIGNGGSSGSLGKTDIEIERSTILRVNSSAKLSLMGKISGEGAIEKLGSGELSFAESGSTFSGPVNVFAGSIRVTDQYHLSTGATLNFSPGTGFFFDASLGTLNNTFAITSGGSVNLSIKSNGTLTLGGALTGLAGSIFSKGPNGSLLLTGTAANTVGLQVSGGEVTLAKEDVNAVGGGGLTIDFGVVTLDGTGDDQIADIAPVRLTGNSSPGQVEIRFELNGKSETIGSLTGVAEAVISNAAASTSTLIVSAPESATTIYAGDLTGKIDLVVNGIPESVLVLEGDTNYEGDTTVQRGTLQVGGGGTSGRLGATSNIGTITLATDEATLAFNRSDDMVFQREITGAGNFAKHGPGALTLETVTYTGTTTVTGGELRFAGGVPTTSALKLSGGGVLDLGGGTLSLSGTQTSVAGRLADATPGTDIVGSVTLQGGHTLAVGADETLDTLTISETLTLSQGKISFTVLPAGNDLISVGELSLNGSPGSIYLDPKFSDGLRAGSYELIKVNGSIPLQLTDANYFATSLQNRDNAPRGDHLINYEIEINTYDNAVMYNVTGGGIPLRLLWQGTDGTASWKAGVVALPSPASPVWVSESSAENFYEEDLVVFRDGGRPSITVEGVVRPSKVLVDNTAQSYTFQGGEIGDTTQGAEKTGLVKTGTGTLFIKEDSPSFTGHSFTGPVEIRQGVLELNASTALFTPIGVPSALGAGDASNNAGSLILDGGTLRIRHSGGTENLHTSAPVVTNRSFTLGPNNGAIEIASSNNDALVRFTGVVPVAFSGSGKRTLTLGGDAGGLPDADLSAFFQTPEDYVPQQGGSLEIPLHDNGLEALKIVKNGTGAWVLQNVSNSFSGGLEIGGGGIFAFAQGALGKVPEVVVPRNITLSGTILYNASSSGGTWTNEAVTIEGTRGIYIESGDNILWTTPDPTNGISFTINSTISSSGSRNARLIKFGAGTLALNNENTFSGGLYVREGKIIVGTASAIPHGESAGGVHLGESTTLETNGKDVNINSFLSFEKIPGTIHTSSGKIINSQVDTVSTLTIGETGKNTYAAGSRTVDRFIFEGTLEEDALSTLALEKKGQGIATLNLGSASNYSGGVKVLGGILRLGSEHALGQVTSLAVNGNSTDGGTLDLAGRDVDVPIHIAGAGSSTSGITTVSSLPAYDRDQVNGLLGALSNTHPANASTAAEVILTASATIGTLAGINLTHVKGEGSLTLAKLTTAVADPVDGEFTLMPKASTGMDAKIDLPTGGLIVQTKLSVLGGDLTIDARDGVQVSSAGEIVLAATSLATTNIIRKNSPINLAGGMVLVNTTTQIVENFRGAGYITHNKANNAGDKGTIIFDIAASQSYEFSGKIGHTLETVMENGEPVDRKVENSGAIDVVKRGDGTFILSGRNSDYLGVTRIEGGVLELRAPLSTTTGGVLGLPNNSVSNLVIAGGILRDTSGELSYTNRLFTIGVGGATIESSGQSAGLQFLNGGIIYVDSPVDVTLTLGGTNNSTSAATNNRFASSIRNSSITGAKTNLRKVGVGSWTLSGNNLYGGWTRIEDGTLILGSENALPVGATVGLGTSGTAGTLRLNGFSINLRSLTAAETGAANRVVNGVKLAAGAAQPVLTVNVADTGPAYTGTLGEVGANAISNAFRFVKNGTGTFELAGPLAYTGDTEVLAGTLKISGQARPFVSSYIFVSPTNQAIFDSSAFNTPRTSGLYINNGLTLVAGGDGIYQNLVGDYRLSGGTIHIAGTRSEKIVIDENNEPISRQTLVNDRAGILRVSGDFYSEEGTASSIVYTFAPTITGVASGIETDYLKVGLIEFAGEVKVLPYIEPSEYAGYRLATTTPGDASAGIYPIIGYDVMLADVDTVSQLKYGLEDPRYDVTFENDAVGKVIYMRVTATSTSPIVYWEGVPNTFWGDPEREGRNFKQDGVQGYVSYTPGAHAYFTDRVTHPERRNVVVSTQGIEFGAATFDNSEGHDYTLSAAGGEIRGAGYLEKIGTGALTINNSNAYTGGTVLGGGRLIIGNDRALGTGPLFLQGGTFASTGQHTISNTVDVQGNASVDTSTGDLIFAGILKGAGTLAKKGLGTLTLSGNSTELSGSVNHQKGVVAIGENTRLGNASFVLSNEAILTASFDSDGDIVIGSLAGSGTVKSTTSGLKNFRVGGKNATDTTLFSGIIQNGDLGEVAFAKEGAGTLVLSGTQNNYTGVTTIKEGILQIGNGESVGTAGVGGINIESAGTLRLDGGRVTTISLDRAITSTGKIEKQGENILIFPRDNPALGGTVHVVAGEVRIGTGATSTAGDLGYANIINDATLIFDRGGDYTVGNNLSGSGVLLKLNSGTLFYTGDSMATGTTRIVSGAVSLGNGMGTRPQVFLSSEVNLVNSKLILNPGPESTLTLGAAVTGNAGTVDKDGMGTAILTGKSTFLGTLNLNSGILQIGDGGTNGSLESSAQINVNPVATLRFNRTGSTEVVGRITSRGEIHINGGTDGTGTVIFMANNDIAGDVYVNNKATLQLGNGGRTGSLGSSEIGTTVHLAHGAAFVFNRDGLETKTGATVTIEGSGDFVKLGKGTTLFNSMGNHTGGTIVEDGRLIISTTNLPRAVLNPAYDIEQTAHLTANGEGILELRNDTTAFTLGGRIRGTGTLALGAEDTVAQGAYALYHYNPIENNERLQTLDVLSRVNLALGNDPVVRINVGTLGVQQGAILTGQGTIGGSLLVNSGGEVRSGAPQGRINIEENIISSGTITITLDRDTAGALQYDSLHYVGTAEFKSGARFNFDFSKLGSDLPKKGSEIYFLVDESEGNNPLGASVIGNFSINTELRGEAITYNNGKGLTLLFASSVYDIPGARNGLHNGLDGFMKYLDGILMATGREDAFAALDSLLKADGSIGKNLTKASPLGLASLTAMSVTSAQHASGSVRSHLESMRYERAINGAQIDFAPYISGAGIFAKNGSSVSAPVYDFNSYGGLVGVDTSLGQHLLGLSASYNTATATMHDGAGKTNADTARLTLYGTFTASQWVSLDAQLFAGYSSYNVKHDTTLGRATAKPSGYDLGASAYVTGIIPLPGKMAEFVHFTPYAGLEFVSATVDSFTESPAAIPSSALDVDGFTQNSLRAKIGTGLNWVIPTKAGIAWRFALEAAYAHELLDSKVDLKARFANDTSTGKFKATAASTAEKSLLIGPSVELTIGEYQSVQFGYTLEYAFGDQTIHHVNASYRIRF